MNPSDLKFDQLQTELLARIPELKNPVDDAFGTDYDLTKETPGGYPIFEDVVLDFLLKNLNSSQNANLLTQLFDFSREWQLRVMEMSLTYFESLSSNRSCIARNSINCPGSIWEEGQQSSPNWSSKRRMLRRRRADL